MANIHDFAYRIYVPTNYSLEANVGEGGHH